MTTYFCRPDYGDGIVDDDLDPDYVDAKKAGLYGVDCSTLYPTCELGFGLLDLIAVTM